MTSDDGFGFLGVIGIVAFGAVGAAIGAAVGMAAASTAVGAAVGATAAGAAAVGAAGGAVVGSTVGVAWINKYRKKTREWIENHPRKGSLIYRVLLKAHEWFDDGMVFLKANLIAKTTDDKEYVISEEKIPLQRAEALGLLTKNGNISKRERKVATAEDILKMKMC